MIRKEGQLMVSRSLVYIRNTYIHTGLKPLSGHVLFYYSLYAISGIPLYDLLYSINLIRV